MFSIPRTNFATRLPCVAIGRSISVILLSAVFAAHAFAQESPTSHTGPVTPVSELLAEAEKNNPQIEAARQGWQAAKQVSTQVSTMPDPQFNLQHVSVGSPRPFAGYTNSDFAYLGLGVSQDIPYPGKLRLKGEIAKRDVDVSQQQIESVRRAVLAELKGTYFQLAYLSKTLGILEQDGELLKQVEQAADARYRSGLGTQPKNEAGSRNRHASPAGRQTRSPAQTASQPFAGITGHRDRRSSRNTSGANVRRSLGCGASTESGNRWRTKNDREAVVAGGPRPQRLLSRLQRAVHVATHGPRAVPRLLHAERRHQGADLSQPQTAP